MATVEYTKYSFNHPPTLVKADYEILKELLTENPSYKLNPPSNFFETFKVELIFLSVGSVGFLIAYLDIAEWLNWVGGIPAFLAITSLFSFIPSLFSYSGFATAKSGYYFYLKRDIIESDNYNEFLILRNNR